MVSITLRRTLLAMSLIGLVLCQTAGAQGAAKNNDPNSPRRWKVEYLKNGKWVGSTAFDTRKLAQAKLDSQRKPKRSSKSGPLVTRIVPTDWYRWENLGTLSAKYEAGGR